MAIWNIIPKDTYELSYEIATQTQDLISIVFRGYSNFDIDQSPNTYPSGYSYYKEGELHLVMSVPHVFGDFIELRFQ